MSAIREARRAKGLNQDQMAAEIGIGVSTLVRLERQGGEESEVKDVLAKIAKVKGTGKALGSGRPAGTGTKPTPAKAPTKAAPAKTTPKKAPAKSAPKAPKVPAVKDALL